MDGNEPNADVGAMVGVFNAISQVPAAVVFRFLTRVPDCSSTGELEGVRYQEVSSAPCLIRRSKTAWVLATPTHGDSNATAATTAGSDLPMTKSALKILTP